MKTILKKILAIIFTAATVFPVAIAAQDTAEITDWYLKDFQSTITVNADSSLLIEEKIVADCGNLPDKHGIFRVVPFQTRTENGNIKTPISLIGITDFSGNNIPYEESTDNFNHTISWKVGDPNKTVTGENYYKIVYSVKNAVRSQNNDFDELYWNLTGNFWDIQIDKFNAKIILPEGINQGNSEIYLYSGNTGNSGNEFSDYKWNGDVLEINSTKTLAARQGITASISFPKGTIAAYAPDFWEIYGNYFWFLIPLAVFILCLAIWSKYGKDPRVDKTIIPEFEIPESLTPMEMGMLASSGGFDNKLITATIIDLAVRKYIVIEDIPKSGIFGKQDFRIKKIGEDLSGLNGAETVLMEKLFRQGQEILLSKLKNDFYKYLPEIKKTALESLKTKALVYQSGLTGKNIFLGIAAIFFFGVFAAIGSGNFTLGGALVFSAAIMLAFGLLMPKRTLKGAELNWRIKGFKLYMETAERYRAQFYEKENIFEKFLPYAIVFGIARLWAKKMEEIYGSDYFKTYHPVWYAGTFNGNFDANTFSSQLNTISAGIASNIGTASGAHGAGGAGGGGGGGGGGGW